MNRGIFGFMQNYPAYTDADKRWHIELDQSTYFWYDLLVHPPQGHDTKQEIANFLKQLKKTVETQLDKRFIYFLASRTKLRFCMSKKPRYSLFGRDLVLHVEVGASRKQIKTITTMRDHTSGKRITPPVEVSDRFITVEHPPGHKMSYPIHDFFDMVGVEFGIDTQIHYVGYTKNPDDRPLNRAHRGLADMLYKVSNAEHDFFIFYNLFKVLSIAGTRSSAFNFIVANSMIDEVRVDEEGRIIEKVLIKYFSTEIQELNKSNEEGELENTLAQLASKNNIGSISFDIQVDNPSELYRFYSRAVAAADRHTFTCRVGDNGAEIIPAPAIPIFGEIV
ncbi:MAG TPA: hypothetical protein VGC21_24785 [Telluria sp.]|jgi:hypothetical protein